MQATATGRRPLWLHVGMHKTGTKALQSAFNAHRDAFLSAGVCYPRSGCIPARDGVVMPVHGNLSADITGSPAFRPEYGGIDDVLAEIDASGCRVALLSHEGFHTLYAAPEYLVLLRDRIRAGGFEPHVLMYVRSQADILESMYVTMLRAGLTQRFDAFLSRAVADGSIAVMTAPDHGRRLPLEYGRALDVFARVFGKRHVTARGYRSDKGPDWIVRDALGVIGVNMAEAVATAAFVNRRLATGGALRLLGANVAAADGGALPAPAEPADTASDAAPFQPLHTRDLLRLIARFALDDLRVRVAYKARVAPVTWSRLRTAVSADLGIDPRARDVQRRIRRSR